MITNRELKIASDVLRQVEEGKTTMDSMSAKILQDRIKQLEFENEGLKDRMHRRNVQIADLKQYINFLEKKLQENGVVFPAGRTFINA